MWDYLFIKKQAFHNLFQRHNNAFHFHKTIPFVINLYIYKVNIKSFEMTIKFHSKFASRRKSSPTHKLAAITVSQ